MSASHNKMHPLYWIPPATTRLLDVGCNAGELLRDCGRLFPEMALAGVDMNPMAIQEARRQVPQADIRQTSGHSLPFPDDAFDCITCIEVIEHVPETLRAATIREIGRVLAPGGLFILRCPHDGAFAWTDAQNMRFRFPKLYARLVGRGLRDPGYADGAAEIVWHEHFTKPQILKLMAPSLRLEQTCFGGLFLFPLADLLSWPFYRMRMQESVFLRLLHKMADCDIGINYGLSSFTMLITLRKAFEVRHAAGEDRA